MAVDDAEFKQALSHFASGVTIVTTEHEGKAYGMTVASFASLSLHPPLILICIEKAVKTHDAIAAAGKFGVSILTKSQAEISNRFASKSEDKFSGLDFAAGTSGVPLIAGALTTLECAVAQQLPGGDHSIFVGEVVATSAGEGEPLVYYRSAYRDIT